MFISTRSLCAFALGAAMLLGGATDVAAQGRGGGGGGGGGAPLTPTAYRQSIMQDFGAHTQRLNAIRMGQVGAPADMLARAIIIQQLANSLTNAFPPNSIGEGSRALPAIWENAAGFAERVQAAQSAANALVEAARSGNAEQVATAQMGLQQTCGACHTAFRGPAPGQ